VLGFETSSGFECVSNFDIEVNGYVGDGGHIVGYIISIKLDVTDPQAVGSSEFR
jgi:hypothetical protein